MTPTIKETPLTPVLQELICECGTAMEHTGMVLTSVPMQYPHACPKCPGRATVHARYPRVEHKKVS